MHRTRRVIATGVAVGSLVCGLAACTSSGPAQDTAASASPTTSSSSTTSSTSGASTPSPSPSDGPAADSTVPRGLPAVPDIVDEVQPSVVTIRTPIGLGSGVVYKSNGVIVTDAHVIEDRSDNPFSHVKVQFADGKTVDAKVIAADDITDVAVIKADRKNLPVPKYADSLPEVGQMCVVIGSPLGLAESATAGIISGLHRRMPPSKEAPQGLFNLIQTDAPISPGNSGGPVVNGDAVVVGLSEAYIPPSEGAVAIGFVTPSTIVTSIADQLLANGKAKHAFLGIRPADISPQMVQLYGLPRHGVLVISVTHNGPAAQAGMKRGDVITKLAGEPISDVTDLLAALRKQQPGQTVSVQIDRAATSKTLHVTLANRPS